MSVSNGPNLGVMINAATGDAFPTDFRKLLRAIDVLLQGATKSKTLATPPGSPANGDRYIIAASPTGAWSGHATHIAVWTTDNPASPSGVWEFYTPQPGWVVANIADSTLYVFLSGSWTAVGGGGGGATVFTSLTDVPSSYTGQGGKAVEVNSGETALVFSTKPLDVASYIPGIYTASEVLLTVPVTRAVNFAANFSGSVASLADANATGAPVFIINKIHSGTPTQIGTITISSGGSAGTLASTSGAAQSLAAGDYLQIVGPSSADATAAGLSFALQGTR